jgi:allantoin racemase
VKIWYQSMSWSSAWGSYHTILRNILDTVKDPNTEIELHGITKIGGVADQYRYLEYLETGEVMENVQSAVRRGFDAFLIGNIADPGLRECREIANIPVLGLCESSMHLACQMGANFALVTINEKFTPRIVENAHRAGLTSRLKAVERMKTERILRLADAFDSEEAKQEIVGQFLKAARTAVDKGAEVIIPAGGVVMAILAYYGVYEAGRGAPILNGITSLVKIGEAVTKLDKLMNGHFISKRLEYAPPEPEQIKEIRERYGNVYPTVKEA